MSKHFDFVEFAKAYKDCVNDRELLKSFAPLYMNVSMPGGYCIIEDCNRDPLAQMRTKLDLGPSCPVAPHLIGIASIFVNAANAVLVSNYYAEPKKDA